MSAIDQRKGGVRLREMPPDELEHEELVKIGVEKRTRDGIELPVMVVRAPGQIDNHSEFNVMELAFSPEAGSGAPRIRESVRASLEERSAGATSMRSRTGSRLRFTSARLP